MIGIEIDWKINIYMLLVMLIMGCGKPSEEKSAEVKPNILFIAVDDLRPELGCYGVDQIITPVIDRLADEGTIFTQAYCQMSWCSPSRTSLLTGMYPMMTGVYDLQAHFRSVLPDIKTLPEHFKDQGYTTLSIGKIFHNNIELQDSLSWSAEAWFPPGPNPIQAYATEHNRRIANSNPSGKASVIEAAAVPDNAYPDGQSTEKALETLEKLSNAGNPFFLAVGYYKPHLPFTAPAEYWELYDRKTLPLSTVRNIPPDVPDYVFREWSEPGSYTDTPDSEPFSDSLERVLKHGYYACVSFVDHQIGRMIQKLEDLDIQKNTIIVLWGDHGFKLGEFGRWSKHSVMEVDTRVPLIVVVPWAQIRGNQVNGIVELVDLFPTLCDLAGIGYPDQPMDGISFADFVHDRNPGTKKFAYSTIIHDNHLAHSLRNENFRFTAWFSQDKDGEMEAVELYDLRKDGNPTVNLAGAPEYKQIVSGFLDSLEQVLTHKGCL